MSTAKISPLVGGLGRYKPETGWPPLRACFMTVLILVVSALSGLTVFLVAADWSSLSEGRSQGPVPAQLLVAQLLMQIAAIAMVGCASEQPASENADCSGCRTTRSMVSVPLPKPTCRRVT